MSNPKYLEINEADLEKVQKRKHLDEIGKVPIEWRLLSEFGIFYGWGAVQAVRNNEIDSAEFNYLLSGGRKVWAARMIDNATVHFTALAASKSKKPRDVMNKGLKHFNKEVG
jgi:hypothetical protein